MAKKKLETEVAEAVEAIETAKEEIEDVAEAINNTKKEKKAKPSAKPSNNKVLADRILAIMQKQKANGVLSTNTGDLKDKLKEKTRGRIRRVMKLLAKDGKVVIGEKTFGKRKRFSYRLAE